MTQLVRTMSHFCSMNAVINAFICVNSSVLNLRPYRINVKQLEELLVDTYLWGRLKFPSCGLYKTQQIRCLYKCTCFILSLIVKLSLTKLPKMLNIWIQNQGSKTYFYTLSMHTSAMECFHLLLNHEQHLSAGKESSDAACFKPPSRWTGKMSHVYTVQVDTMMWTPCTLSRSRCLLSVSRDVSL